MPRPAPVTIQTRPSQIPTSSPCFPPVLVAERPGDSLWCRSSWRTPPRRKTLKPPSCYRPVKIGRWRSGATCQGGVMRRPRLRLVLGISIPVLVIVVLLAAWALDASNASGKVPRNVTLAGRDVSLMAEDTLAATVADIAKQYSTTKVKLRTDDRTYEVEAAKLGLHLDEKATVRGALDIDEAKSKSPAGRWFGFRHFSMSAAPRSLSPWTMRKLEAGLATLGGNAGSTEPAIVNTASRPSALLVVVRVEQSIVRGRPAPAPSPEPAAARCQSLWTPRTLRQSRRFPTKLHGPSPTVSRRTLPMV